MKKDLVGLWTGKFCSVKKTERNRVCVCPITSNTQKTRTQATNKIARKLRLAAWAIAEKTKGRNLVLAANTSLSNCDCRDGSELDTSRRNAIRSAKWGLAWGDLTHGFCNELMSDAHAACKASSAKNSRLSSVLEALSSIVMRCCPSPTPQPTSDQ